MSLCGFEDDEVMDVINPKIFYNLKDINSRNLER